MVDEELDSITLALLAGDVADPGVKCTRRQCIGDGRTYELEFAQAKATDVVIDPPRAQSASSGTPPKQSVMKC